MVQSGQFWAHREAMPGILQEMLQARRVPIAKMKNFFEFRQLELRDEKQPTIVRALPGMWRICRSSAHNFVFWHAGKCRSTMVRGSLHTP